MSEYSRGPYTPGDEPPLAFERRRREERPPPRRSGPPPLTLILSLVLLIGVGGAVAFMYRAGLRGPAGAPRPVGTPIGDVRVAPPPQAQPVDPAAGLSIYKNAPDAAAPAFTPPPELPAPRPTAAAPPLAPPAPSASAASVANSPPPAASAVHPTAATEAKPKLAAAQSPKPPASAAKPKPKAKPATIDALIAQNTQTEPAPPTHKPHARAAADKDEAGPVSDKPKPQANSKAKSESKSKPASGAVVQIGAFSSRELANAAASHVGSAGHGRHIVPVTKPDGSVLYRTSITGFASRDEASAFCAKLKGAASSCFVPR